MKKLFLIIFLGILIILPLISSAAGLVPCGSPPRCCESGETPDKNLCSNDSSKCEPACQFCHFFVMFKNVIDFLLVPCPLNHNFPLVPIIAILMIAIGGFMFFFGGVKPEVLTQAKSIFKATVIALVIIYGAWLFVGAFFTAIGVADWTGLEEGWWKINCP